MDKDSCVMDGNRCGIDNFLKFSNFSQFGKFSKFPTHLLGSTRSVHRK